MMMTLRPALALAALTASLTACELAQPFEGPGFSLGDGLTTDAPGPFIAAATDITVADTAEAQKAFDDHMAVIQEAIKTQPGLIGSSLMTVLGTKRNRTLTVWESEEAMLDWVVSEAHGAAMVDMADKAAAGATTSWSITREEMPPTWDDAKARIESDGKVAY